MNVGVNLCFRRKYMRLFMRQRLKTLIKRIPYAVFGHLAFKNTEFDRA